ncbi:MAG TPA: peptidylprolyl isomerase [Candidatus Limnocylindrales bacterium]
MTSFRGRPSGNRARTWDDRDRRSMLLNIGFGLTIVAALLLLVIAFAATWYDANLAPAGSVNGQTITKDEFNKQVAINKFRIDYAQRRIRTLLTAGQIRTSDAQARLSALDQRAQQASTIALEQLIDGKVMESLAPAQGVAVTDADVDARLTEEATTPELRHAWMIAIAPKTPDGATAPDAPAKAEARAAAAKALTDLKSGKSFGEIAKGVSTDASSAQGGDIGFVDDNASLDKPFVDALFAAKEDAPTEVIEGADGTFRVGEVTQIVAPIVDATLEAQVKDDGINVADYRAALRRDVVRTKLSDAILAQYLAPGPQRQVAQIFMQAGTSESLAGAIKVRHILYSPNGDPSAAANVPTTDQAWKDAEAKARATYDKLKANPSQFDAIARAESDEDAAATSGGKLPYFAPADSIDKAFADAIFAPGLQPGQLLQPVQSAFGWHVIQVMHGPTDLEWANKLKTDIEAGRLTFSDAARDNSDNADAAKGGDIGWVGKGQLSEAKEAAVFAAPVGKVSDPVVIPDDGTYVFFVAKEETRAPDADQKAALESSAFSIWYSKQKAGFTITRDPAIVSATS